MLSSLMRTWGLLRKGQKLILSGLALARILANGLDIVGLALIGVFGALVTGLAIPVPLRGLLNQIPLETTITILILVTFVFLIKTSLGLLLSRATSAILGRIEAAFAKELTLAIFLRGYEHQRRLSQPEVEWAILRSSHKAFTVFLGSSIAFLAEVTLAIAVFAFLFLTDWILSLGVTVYFAAILFLFQLYSKKIMHDLGEAYTSNSIKVNSSINNLIVGYKELFVVSKLEVFLKPLIEARSNVAQSEATNMYLQSVPRILMEIGLILGAIGLVGVQLLRTDSLEGAVTIGIFLMGSLRMMSALLPLQRSFQTIVYEAPAAKKAQVLLQEFKLDVKGRAFKEAHFGAVLDELDDSEERIAPSIVMKDVHFIYDDSADRVPALRDINLAIEGGSNVAFIGPSGGGKSSLVELISGLLTPSSGEITFKYSGDNHYVDRVRAGIALVPQKPGILSGTLLENITLGETGSEVDRTSLERAISMAQLAELVQSLPLGLLTPLGKHLDSLSGGQLQRIGLARALYTNPRILILDEATSALDPETEHAIAATIHRLHGTVTVIVVAHRLSTVQGADRIYIVDAGAVVAEGTFAELRVRGTLLKRYVDLLAIPD